MTRRYGTPNITQAQRVAAMNLYKPPGMDLGEKLAFMNDKPRAQRTRKNVQEEHDGQAAMVAYLHRCCPSVIVSASLNGELRPQGDMGRFYGWIKKLKLRGMLSGDPDLRLNWHPGRTVFIECKRKSGGVESEAQERVRYLLQAAGFGVYTARTIDELKDVIRREAIPCVDRIP